MKNMGVKFACSLEWIAKWISIKNKKRYTRLCSNVIEIDRKTKRSLIVFFEIFFKRKISTKIIKIVPIRVLSWKNILIYKSFFFIRLILETISVAEIWATDESNFLKINAYRILCKAKKKRKDNLEKRNNEREK